MPITIQPHQSSEGIRTSSGGSGGTYRSAADYITPGQAALPGAVQTFGQSLQQLGSTISSISAEERREQLNFAVMEDLQHLMGREAEWRAAYPERVSGMPAEGAAREYTDFIKEHSEPLLNKYAKNPQALRHIRGRVMAISRSGADNMQRYATAQVAAHQDSLVERQHVQLQNLLNNPSVSMEELANAERDYAALRQRQLLKKGAAPEAVNVALAEDFKKLHKSRLENRLAVYRTEDARSGLDMIDAAISGSSAGNVAAKLPPEYAEAAIREAASKGIDQNLVLAVMLAESGGKADALSPKGASGLLQLMPATQAELEQKYGVSGDTPEGNITLGVSYLKELSDKYHGDITNVLMSYNWGQGHVDSWLKTGKGMGGKPVPKETIQYVKSVTKNAIAADAMQIGVEQMRELFTPRELTALRGPMQQAARQQLKERSIASYSALPPEEAARAALADPALQADPETQRAIVTHLDFVSSQKNKARKQEQLAALEQQYGDIASAAQRNNRAEIDRILKAARPEDQTKLAGYAGRLVNGDGLPSDPTALDDMIERIAAGEPVQVEAEYAEHLSLKDLRRGKDMLARRELAEHRVREKAAFDEESKKYKTGITATEKAALFRQFEASIPEGGHKDPAQRQKALTSFWRKITVDKPWSLSRDIRGFQEREYAAQGYSPVKGAEYQQLRAAVIARGGTGTDAEITRLYQEIHGIQQGGGQ